MSLAEYKKMRRFDQTPEPSPTFAKRSRGPDRSVGAGKDKKLEFVVQKHQASRLHYDFRLELDGVLKSWAVPKGPSLNPKDKRLAMMVEDHPFEYRKFEGTIPEGNYGAGKVIIWDRGWYELHREDESWPATLQEGLKKGDLKFTLHGQKLKGSFALIKTLYMGKNAWLLIKHKDKYANSSDITKQSKSVVSGKEVEEIAENANSQILKNLRIGEAPKAGMPKRVKPMLATLVSEVFDGDEWLFEAKYDGFRAIASWDGKKAELYSRNGLDFSHKFFEVAEGLKYLTPRHGSGQASQVVLDGEIVAVDTKGKSHFEWLQNWGRQPKGNLVYFVFDILWCNGHDLRAMPLEMRKAILRRVLPQKPIFKYSEHVKGKGKDFFAATVKHGLEGVVAKKANSPYREAYRGREWLKIKTHLRQEVVVGGFTEPRGSRKYIGALILGVYDKGELVYVGHTGGGIPTDQLKPLRQKMERIEIKESPFARPVKPNAPVHWVKPELVCEVSFSEWTKGGHMRQPIFVGMRNDKSPKHVKREFPKEKK